ncbi:TM2 domain-containing protein [Paraburkholderia xenovorans]
MRNTAKGKRRYERCSARHDALRRTEEERRCGYLSWFFLGSPGGHRFYVGRKGTAIVQLLLTLVDACMYGVCRHRTFHSGLRRTVRID